MDYAKEALRLHAEWNGKLETVPKMNIENKDDLSIAYTPGVAAPCLEIEKDKKNSYVYTGRSHTVAVISDGSAVLGLGNIGPEAGMPVMEGKCVLFKAFADVDAFAEPDADGVLYLSGGHRRAPSARAGSAANGEK